MSFITSPKIDEMVAARKFAGDGPETLQPKQLQIVLDAMSAARTAVYPMTARQMDDALGFSGTPQHTEKLVAALICAEADLHRISEDDSIPKNFEIHDRLHEQVKRALLYGSTESA